MTFDKHTDPSKAGTILTLTQARDIAGARGDSTVFEAIEAELLRVIGGDEHMTYPPPDAETPTVTWTTPITESRCRELVDEALAKLAKAIRTFR